MKVVCISDTHGRHPRLRIPSCDVLVHAGDATVRGRWSEMEPFLEWMADQPATYKVLIAGNHDRCCEAEPERMRSLAEGAGVRYLCDEGLDIEGRSLWGSPVTPRFRDMAFNRERGSQIAEHWAEIPDGLDLLITHGPPKEIGDRMILGMHVGCSDLAARVREVRPRFHVFGHIHEAAGGFLLDDVPTKFFNVASSRLLRGRPRDPVILYL
jgi:predicted phosphodiesterase